MILEQLGMLAENASLTTANSAAFGYTLDLESVYNKLGFGPILWVVIKTTVAAGGSNGTFQFMLRQSETSDGTDLSGSPDILIETPAIAQADARVAAAGAYILRCSLPYEADLQYLQMYKTFAGTTPTISVDVSISPSRPPSDRNIAVHVSPVGVP
jgi:hypothetical protein